MKEELFRKITYVLSFGLLYLLKVLVAKIRNKIVRTIVLKMLAQLNVELDVNHDGKVDYLDVESFMITFMKSQTKSKRKED